MHVALRSFPAELLGVPFPNPMIPRSLISPRFTGAAQSTFSTFPSLQNAWRRCRSVQQEQIPWACGTHAPRSHLVPVRVQIYGHLRKLKGYIRTLSDTVLARSLLVTRASFVAVSHREVRVATVQTQGYAQLLRTVARQGCRVAGVARQRWYIRPSLTECYVVVASPVSWLCLSSASVLVYSDAARSLGSFPFVVDSCACFMRPYRL
jgi:hypothetical protein